MSRQYWTPTDDAKLRALHPSRWDWEVAQAMGRSTLSVKGRAVKLGLRKSAAFVREFCRWTPGEEPHNKGRPHNPAGAEKGRFGYGRMPSNGMPLGATKMHDGVLLVKVAVKGRKWRPAKDVAWEAHSGPIPPHRIVVTVNGDTSDTRPENLLCLTRAENLRRNSAGLDHARRSAMTRAGWETRRARREARA